MEQTKKFYIALMLVSLFCLWLGQTLGSRQGLLIAFFLIFALNTYIYYFSAGRIRRTLNSRLIEGHDPWGIRESLNKYCQRAYIPLPKVFSSPLASPTSIIFGKHPTKSNIVLSEYLLKYLDRDDLNTLIALEVARIKHIDTLALAMFSNLMAMFLGISKCLDYVIFLQFLFKPERRIMPLSQLTLSVFRLIYSLCVPKKSYFAADKLAADMVDAKKVAQLLWKLESYTSTQPMDVPLDMAHLYVVNPIPSGQLYSRLKYQPNFEERIKKLIGYFPI